MRVGLIVHGPLDSRSGGYLYDGMLVRHLRERGDDVEVIDLPAWSTAACLFDNLDPRLLRRVLDLDLDVSCWRTS